MAGCWRKRRAHSSIARSPPCPAEVGGARSFGTVVKRKEVASESSHVPVPLRKGQRGLTSERKHSYSVSQTSPKTGSAAQCPGRLRCPQARLPPSTELACYFSAISCNIHTGEQCEWFHIILITQVPPAANELRQDRPCHLHGHVCIVILGLHGGLTPGGSGA